MLRDKISHVGHLSRPDRVQVGLPFIQKLPRVPITVELSGGPAKHCPVLLASERHWARVIVLTLVVRLYHEDRVVFLTVVFLEYPCEGRKVGIGCVERD